MTETVFAATARVYANGGWSVFPLWWVAAGRCACRAGANCKSPGKHPIFLPAHGKDDPARATCKGECGQVGHGVHDATTDLDTIADWWTRWPDANIGLPAGGNGLAIIDVDPRHGGDESFANLNAYAMTKGVDLTATLAAHTGGDGLHLIYTAPEGGIKSGANVFGPDMPGLDTRGRGGYIVAWPSDHISGGRYEWVDFSADPAPWPDFLTLLIEPKKLEHVIQPAPTRRGPIGDKYAAGALDKELAVLESTRSGRNDQLNVSSFNLGTLVGAGLLDENIARGELYNAAVRNGYVAQDGARETLGTINSGLRAGMAKPRAGVR